MTHAEAQELLAALSLDATSSQERDAILAHVAECDECARELGELRDVAYSMTHLAPEMPMDPARQARVRAHLLARATERAQPAAPTPKPATISMQPRRLTQFSTARLAAAAAIVVVGIALALWAVSAGERANALQRDTQRLLAAQRSFEREIAARDSALADRQALLDAMTGADVQVIEAGAPSTRQPSGKMFWDQVTGQWTFVAHNLPHAAPNRTYQLWLITRAQRKISAGVFATSASGDALVIAHYSLPKDSLAAIAVTDEPSGGSPQPTTTPVLVGTAQ
ncbi:MAG TPA: anti-sigma factor [Gemmatimonadaceae bacterium]|nr:anti-sigma factor [Gemmatimonadaceae bacterium]